MIGKYDYDKIKALTEEVENLTSELLAVENYQEELLVLRSTNERLKIESERLTELNIINAQTLAGVARLRDKFRIQAELAEEMLSALITVSKVAQEELEQAKADNAKLQAVVDAAEEERDIYREAIKGVIDDLTDEPMTTWAEEKVKHLEWVLEVTK